jgi:hypothetical protein
MSLFDATANYILESLNESIILTESRRFPISVRNKNYKNLEREFITDPAFKAAADEIWRKFNDNPEDPSIDFSFLGNNIKNAHGTWYKLSLRIPGSRTHYRLLGFEPREARGLIIWDWIGTHEDYNKIWAQKAGSLPGGWYLSKGGLVNYDKLEPWLQAAVDATKNAKEKNLPYGQAELDAKAKRAAVSKSKQALNLAKRKWGSATPWNAGATASPESK